MALLTCWVYGGFWLLVVVPFGSVMGWGSRTVTVAICAGVCIALSVLSWRFPRPGAVLLLVLAATVAVEVGASWSAGYAVGITFGFPVFFAATIFAFANYRGESWGTMPWPWWDAATWWRL
jgi:hypothetical protein